MYDNDEDLFPAPMPYQVPKDAKKIKEGIRRAGRLWQCGEFREAGERYIELGHRLKSPPPGPERSRVVQQMSRLEAD